jgi:hypothetical protein
VRQMVVNGVTTADSNAAAPTGGIFMLPAGGTAQRDNVQVMTFTATSTEGPSSATSTTTGGGTSSGTVTTPAPTPKQ